MAQQSQFMHDTLKPVAYPKN